MLKKIFGGLLLTGVIIFIAKLIYFLYAFGVFEKDYSKQDLIENYELKKNEINDLYAYTNIIVQPKDDVHIEFESDKHLGIFHVVANTIYDSNWNIDVDSKKVDTLLVKLGWTKETLNILKDKLDKANCISIESGEPLTLGFQRSGMGIYFYKVFKKPLSSKLIEEYNDGCNYIFYKENIVLEYGGGVIGTQCFERK